MSDASQRWPRVCQLFHRAIGAPPETWAALLEHEEPDPAIRSEAMELLQGSRDETFLETPVSISAELVVEDRLIGREICGYTVLRRLGVGGMGVVYEARQSRPSRLVALKLIRPDLVTERGLDRFRREIEILGRLQHPGIAAVHDAGLAPADLDALGRAQPYCAMELVRGEPLLQWADANALDRRARLELLARVCDAVDHAHRRDVIHRDLKPANILVAEDGQPKVLDFGIARAMDAVTTSTLATVDGGLMGTLGCMSPEQLAGSSAVDARSDVYALGVLGYELLAGRPAFDVRDRSLPEAIRQLQHEEPTRLGRLRRDLAGDVEVVIGKAMDRDPARRYGSAALLATDLRACADSRPVSARPPSALYLAGRFARRHRASVALGTFAFAALIAATTWTSLAWRTAAAESQRVQRVNHYLTELLRWFDPARAGGPNFSLKEALDQASEQLESAQGMDADLAAEIHTTLGDRYFSLGAYGDAEAHHRRSFALRSEVLGEQSLPTALSRVQLAQALRGLRRTEEAIGHYRAALETRAEIAGPRDPLVAECLNGIGAALAREQRYTEAEPYLRDAVAIMRQAPEPSRIQFSTLLGNLGVTLMAMGRVEEALPFVDEAVAMRRAISGDDPQIADLLENASTVLLHTGGRREPAESMLRQVLEIRGRLLPADSDDLFRARHNLSVLLRRRGANEEALSLLQQSLASLQGSQHLTDKRRASLEQEIAQLLDRASMNDAAPATAPKSAPPPVR